MAEKKSILDLTSTSSISGDDQFLLTINVDSSAVSRRVAASVLGSQLEPFTTLPSLTDRVSTLENADYVTSAALSVYAFQTSLEAVETRLSVVEINYATQTSLDAIGSAVGSLEVLVTVLENSVADLNQRVSVLEAGGTGGEGTLVSLTDTSIADVSANDILSYDGSQWVNERSTIVSGTPGFFGVPLGSTSFSVFTSAQTSAHLSPFINAYGFATSTALEALEGRVSALEAGGGSGGVTTFVSLTDVSIADVSANDTLSYDAASSQWKNIRTNVVSASPGFFGTPEGGTEFTVLTTAQTSALITPFLGGTTTSIGGLAEVSLGTLGQGDIFFYNLAASQWSNIGAEAYLNAFEVVRPGVSVSGLTLNAHKVQYQEIQLSVAGTVAFDASQYNDFIVSAQASIEGFNLTNVPSNVKYEFGAQLRNSSGLIVDFTDGWIGLGDTSIGTVSVLELRGWTRDGGSTVYYMLAGN